MVQVSGSEETSWSMKEIRRNFGGLKKLLKSRKDQKKDVRSFEVHDWQVLRNRFCAERYAVEQLVSASKEHRDNLLNLNESATKLAQYISLLVGSDHPRHDTIVQFARLQAEFGAWMMGAMEEMLNEALISSPAELAQEYEETHRALQRRDQALISVQKMERKHEKATCKTSSEEKVMYTGERLKEAINTYALHHERTVNKIVSCHGKLNDLIEPAVVNLVKFESTAHLKAAEKLGSIAMDCVSTPSDETPSDEAAQKLANSVPGHLAVLVPVNFGSRPVRATSSVDPPRKPSSVNVKPHATVPPSGRLSREALAFLTARDQAQGTAHNGRKKTSFEDRRTGATYIKQPTGFTGVGRISLEAMTMKATREEWRAGARSMGGSLDSSHFPSIASSRARGIWRDGALTTTSMGAIPTCAV